MLSNQVIYLHTVDLNDRCKKSLQQLQLGNLHGLNLEKLYGYQIWSIRVSDEARLLLTRTTIQGETAWLVLEYLPTHNYESSRFLQPNVLKRFLEQHKATLNKLNPYDFQPNEGIEEQLNNPEPTKFQRAHYYNHEYICLNQPQEEILKKSFPLVLSGMPGSGKTCIGFILLENYLRQNTGVNIRVLYISLSQTLANNKKREWLEATETTNISNSGLEFMSVADWMANDPAIKSLQQVGYAEFGSWLSNLKSTLDASILYEEFKCISVFRDEAEYISQSGTRNSLYHTLDDKKSAYLMYQKYNAYLKDLNKVDLFFYAYIATPKYDFIFVDESQNLSQMQLSCLLHSANQHQICYAMDTNQNMQKGVSTRPYLLQILAQTTGQTVNHCQLLQTFRNPTRIVELANGVLQIKNVLVGGVADNHEYTQTIALADANKTGFVAWHNKATDELIALSDHPSCAIVVNSEAAKALANQIFNSPLIFTREEIQGLQFETIILFDPFDDPALKRVNKAIPEDMADRTIKPNRPKDKNDLSSLEYVKSLNALYTAITRSSDAVHIVSGERHENKKIIAHLKSTQKTVPTEAPKAKLAATEEEWEARAIELANNNNTAQADEIYRRKLKKSRTNKTVQTSVSQSTCSTTSYIDLEKFVETPTTQVFSDIINSEHYTTLLYRTKLKSGHTLFETFRSNIKHFIPLFCYVNESLTLFKILATDPSVAIQLIYPQDSLEKNLSNLIQHCSQSSVGTEILNRTMLNNPKAFWALVNKNRHVFWNIAPALLLHESGRDLVAGYASLTEQPLKTLTANALFANKLFQHLCIDEVSVRALLSLFMSNPTLINSIDRSILLTPFFHGHNVLSLLCCSEDKIHLLGCLFENNPALLNFVQPNHLLIKQCYILNESTGKYQIKTHSKIPINSREITMTPFHQLSTTHDKLSANLLMMFYKANQFLCHLTIADLYPEKKYKTIECYSPIYGLTVNLSGALLSELIISYPKLLTHVPSEAFFEKPLFHNASTPAYLALLAPEDQLLEHKLIFLAGLLNNRRDHMQACAASLSDQQHQFALPVLTSVVNGLKIIEMMFKHNNQIFKTVDWRFISKPFSEYVFKHVLSRATPFYSMMVHKPKLLAQLMETYPVIVKYLSANTLFGHIPSVQAELDKTKYITTFIAASYSTHGHKMLHYICSTAGQVLLFADEKQLFVQDQGNVNDDRPIDNLCLTKEGVGTVALICDKKPVLDYFKHLTLIRPIKPTIISTATIKLPLVYWMVQHESGCEFLWYVLVNRPDLINQALSNVIFNDIPGCAKKVSETLEHSHAGKQVLQLIRGSTPSPSAFFANSSTPTSSELVTDPSAPSRQN